jgi:7-keto-8-aminopelargonate synthetase-like enzyme
MMCVAPTDDGTQSSPREAILRPMPVARRARLRLEELAARSLLRRCPSVAQRRGVQYELDGVPVVGFCSNDYLGLATSPPPPAVTGAREATGATASRLICGDTEIHRRAEADLAALAGTDDAVLFPSGFQLNVGVLPALLEVGDHVDSDRLNHASLIDGVRLARARPHVVPHGQPPCTPATSDGAIHWWITETIFSMDGDRVDVTAVREHLAAGGAVYADEAHALGLFTGGQGLLLSLGIRASVSIGTLSKALGCAGAFVAAERDVCDLIRNRARSFVFTTGVSPLLATHISDLVAHVRGREGDERRERLWGHARDFAARLGLGDPVSPIFPFVVGDNDLALSLAARLLERGLHVQPIRPPTVPEGTARLRVTLCANHSREHIETLAETLRQLLSAADRPIRLDRAAAAASA